jgi:tetratricopeptide (TPR) repeat protein
MLNSARERMMADYEKLLSMEPSTAFPYNDLGNLTIAHYDREIQSNPSDEENYLNRGRLKFESGDQEGANADFELAIEINRSCTLKVLSYWLMSV